MSHAYMPQDQILELGRRWAKAELQKDTDVLASLRSGFQLRRPGLVSSSTKSSTSVDVAPAT